MDNCKLDLQDAYQSIRVGEVRPSPVNPPSTLTAIKLRQDLLQTQLEIVRRSEGYSSTYWHLQRWAQASKTVTQKLEVHLAKQTNWLSDV